jgi:5-methylcytosine-specific restriction endonuclease McrA
LTKHRIDPEAGFVNRDKMLKGPKGFNLCRQCRKECPSNHRTFCGPKCVDKWKMKTDPGHVRFKVKQRDRGVCARCRLDTTRVRDMLYLLQEMAPEPWRGGREGFPELLRYKREIEAILKVGHRSTYWDADHIKPVKDGGGGCNLRNYQTLCVWCHKAKTKEQATKE